uniref:Sema domain-containing protein n=1 Tax=Panagrellus redivivus TaxID=6233 RepID=A0A7E4VJW3_PANRE
MVSGAVFRLASIAIVVALFCVYDGDAKKVFLECMSGYPVPMNTIVHAVEKANNARVAFVTAADMYGAVVIPNTNDYEKVEIFTQCIHLSSTKDECTPVFVEKQGKTPFYNIKDGETLAIFGSDFAIDETCVVP